MNGFLLKTAITFTVFNYGIAVCMLRNVEKRAKKIVRLQRINIPRESYVPQIKDKDAFYLQIPRDNFFSQLPKELRLKCCPEGEQVWINATMRPALNENISAFQWHMRLEDRKRISSTCWSLRELMLIEDPNLAKHIQKNRSRMFVAMPVPAIKVPVERGLEEGLNSLPPMEYNPANASLHDNHTQACILQ